MTAANLSDFGVRGWSDIVRLERASQTVGGYYSYTPTLSRHQRSWAQVINLQQADLSDFGINRWSQMVLLSRGEGGISRHLRTFADVVDIRPTTLNVANLVRFNPVQVRATDLIRISGGKLRLSDVFDLSELNRLIDARVQSSKQNRRSREDPLAFVPWMGYPGG